MIIRIDLGVLELDVSGLSASQADARLHELVREKECAAFAGMCAQVEAQGMADRSCRSAPSTPGRSSRSPSRS